MNALHILLTGGVLAVARGSGNRPKFIVLEYRRAGRSAKPIVLVGKGVTFDSGGLNLKPGEHMKPLPLSLPEVMSSRAPGKR